MNNVLIVDDEPAVLEGLKIMIDWNALGFEIIAGADNGEDALKIIEEVHPDLVITDIVMPAADGLELIKRAREELKLDTLFIIVSGYGDFEYARKAILYGVKNYITKPIMENELIESLGLIRKELDKRKAEELVDPLDAFVTRMILTGGRRNDTRETLALSLKPGWATAVKGYGLSDGQIDETREFLNDQYKDGLLFRIVPDRDGETLICLFGGRKEETRETLSATFSSLLSRLTKKTGSSPTFLLGETRESPQELGDSYAELNASEAGLFYCQEGVLVNIAALREVELNPEPIPNNDAIIHAMELGNRDEATALLADELKEMEERKAHPTAVYYWTVDLKRAVSGLLYSLESITPDDFPDEAPLSGGREPRTFERYRSELMQAVAESADFIGRTHRKNRSYQMVRIEKFLAIHFRENLSLKELSQQFNMNPVYLGQRFKKHFGILFNDYLHKLRMEEAVKLLIRTDMKIYEIAENLGYGSSDKFTAKFVQTQGITPREFRKRRSNIDKMLRLL